MIITSRFKQRFVPPRFIPPLIQRPLWMNEETSDPDEGAKPAQDAAHHSPDDKEFPHVNRLEILDAFESAHGEYFRLLLKTYPLASPSPARQGAASGTPEGAADSDPEAFGPAELCELALTAQAAAIALGPVAIRRLIHLGFDRLYAFDNPIDQFHWRAQVRSEAQDRSMYAAIAIRIEAEVRRMRMVFKMNGDWGYENLEEETLLVSKARYVPPYSQQAQETPAAPVPTPLAAEPMAPEAAAMAPTEDGDGAAPLPEEEGLALSEVLSQAPMESAAQPHTHHAVDAAAIAALVSLEKRAPRFASHSPAVSTLMNESGPSPDEAAGSGHGAAGQAFIPPGALRI